MANEISSRGALPRVQWGPVITGALCALAAHVVLGLFGVAFGFSAAPTDSTGLGVLAGLWTLLVPLVATAIGAFVCVRIVRDAEPAGAYLHGALVWCIGLLAGALFLSSTLATSAMSSATMASGNLRGGVARSDAGAEEAQKAAAALAGAGGVGALLGLAGAFVGAAAARGALTGRRLGVYAGRRHGPGLVDWMHRGGHRAVRGEGDYERGYREGLEAGARSERSGVVTSSTGRAPEVSGTELRPGDDPTLHH
jgi:hypothetical protein